MADGDPDVFLSYSRKNSDFVRDLHAYLVEKEKDVWVDWEDIPVASEWRDDIARNIVAAAGFVFVVSATSLASAECSKEVDHAIEHGKRIVPIVCDDSHPGQSREEIRKLNWVLCRDGADREEAFARVLQGLDTDLEWTREHARLSKRAVEWEQRKRNSSFLMRGSDLQSAEAALAAGAAKDPAPTELQSEYVLTSRRAATRRQRVLLGGVSIALAVAIGLGVLSLLQRNDARRATKSATSVALAAVANNQLSARPDQALLLSLASYESARTAQAHGAAVAAVEHASDLGVDEFLHGTAAIQALAFAPDKRTVAVGRADGTVGLFDIQAHKALATLSGSNAQAIVDVGFADRGRILMAASDSGVVRLWALPSGRTTRTILLTRPIVAAAISPNGREVVAANGQKQLWLWNTRTDSKRPLAAPEGSKVALAFSPRGTSLAAGVNSDNVGRTIQLYDTTNWKVLVSRSSLVATLTALAFSPNGKLLASADDVSLAIKDGSITDVGVTPYGEVRLWSVPGLKPAAKRMKGSAFNTALAFAPDNRTVLVGEFTGAAGSVKRWLPFTGKWHRTGLRPTSQSIGTLAASGDGRAFVAANSEASTAVVANVHPGINGARAMGSTFDNWYPPIAFSPNGELIGAVRDDKHDNFVPVFLDANGSWPTTPTWLRKERNVIDLAFSPDGGTLAIERSVKRGSTKGYVELWSLSNHTPFARLPRSGFVPTYGDITSSTTPSIRTLGFNPAGDELAVAGAPGVTVLDVHDGTRLGLARVSGGVSGFAFAGQKIVAVGSTGAVTVSTPETLDGVASFRTAGFHPVPIVSGGDNDSYTAAFSADGKTAALAGPGGVSLWTVGSTRPATTLTSVPSGSPVALSPDGAMLAAGRPAETADAVVGLQLWDVATRTPLGQAVPDGGDAESLSFSPSGDALVGLPRDSEGQLLLWRNIIWQNAAELKVRVCGLVVGDFGADEWDGLAPGIAQPHLCG